MFIYQLRCEFKKFQITSQTEGLALLYSLILQSLLHVVKRHVGVLPGAFSDILTRNSTRFLDPK